MRSRGTWAASRRSTTVSQIGDAEACRRAVFEGGPGPAQNLDSAAAIVGEMRAPWRLVRRRGRSHPRRHRALSSSVTAVAADLGELVEGPEHAVALAREPLELEEAVEDLAVIERDREVGHARGREARRG